MAGAAVTSNRASNTRQMQPAVRRPAASVLERFCEQERALLLKLLTEQAEYVHHPIFAKRSAEKRLFGPDFKLDLSGDAPEWHLASELDPDDQSSVGVPALTAEQEQLLFQRFNYARYRVFKVLSAYRGKRLSLRAARQLVLWAQRALAVRGEIVRLNVPLVLAMAKRTRLGGVDFSELISEGNMALLRSVDKFDCSRGFKFSTYACRAILKSFSRVAMRTSRYRGRFPTEFDPALERSDHLERKREAVEVACVDELRDILGQNRANLTKLEETVIRERFALNAPDSQAGVPKTLEQVGQIIGVTKERVRQIQNKALEKIRAALEEGVLAA